MRELVLQRAPLPWEVLHAFLVRELKLDIPFLGVYDCTCSTKKRSTQNNRTRGFIPHIHNNEINGYKSHVQFNHNIFYLSYNMFSRVISKDKFT